MDTRKILSGILILLVIYAVADVLKEDKLRGVTGFAVFSESVETGFNGFHHDTKEYKDGLWVKDVRGYYESEIIDAGSIASWKKLSWKQSWWDTNWRKRMKITIINRENKKADFVELSLRGRISPLYMSSLRFVDENGNVIPHIRDKYAYREGCEYAGDKIYLNMSILPDEKKVIYAYYENFFTSDTSKTSLKYFYLNKDVISVPPSNEPQLVLEHEFKKPIKENFYITYRIYCEKTREHKYNDEIFYKIEYKTTDVKKHSALEEHIGGRYIDYYLDSSFYPPSCVDWDRTMKHSINVKLSDNEEVEWIRLKAYSTSCILHIADFFVARSSLLNYVDATDYGIEETLGSARKSYIKFQVRSCDDPECNGEEFEGPDGKWSYYESPSELEIEDNRYFQYKVLMYGYDECENDYSCVPMRLNRVEITYETEKDRKEVDDNEKEEKDGESGKGEEEEITEVRCEDSDNGRNFYVRGKVKFGNEEKEDECVDNKLLEYYCYEGAIKETLTICKYGCLDGRCVENPVCTDTDGGKKYYIRGSTGFGNEIRYYDFCRGDELYEFYCEDGRIKYEVVGCKYCSNGACQREEPEIERCVDTDGGENYYVKGHVYSEENSYEDVCLGGVLGEEGFYFKEGKMREYYCEGDEVKSKDHYCPFGCYDGRCLPEKSYCVDSDNKNINEGGRGFYVTESGDRGEIRDKCWAGYQLSEGYCRDPLGIDWGVSTSIHDCKYACDEDRCVNYCVDTDGGINPYVGGWTVFEKRKQDTCSNNVLKEYYCDGNEVKEVKIKCDMGCRDEYTCNYNCVDTDGLDLYRKGKVILSSSDKDKYSVSYNDECYDYDTVKEYICGNGGMNVLYRECKNGCKDGVCIKDTDEEEKKSEKEDKESEKEEGRSEKEEKETRDFKQPKYDVLDLISKLKEFIKRAYKTAIGVSDDTVREEVEKDEGEKESEKDTVREEVEKSESICEDTDDGVNPLVSGEVKIIQEGKVIKSREDVCKPGGILRETYCCNGKIEEIDIGCVDNECSVGRCLIEGPYAELVEYTASGCEEFG